VKPRRFPYPYRALLAICSDLDETADADVFFQQMRFLNTRETTPMGPGVGLEIGNTIYFDMPANQFAYWNTTDAGRAMARALIRSGHIDCLHSYGDFATTRAHAGRALDELARHNLSLKVWIDHAVAPTNFGADIMHGHGDEPGHVAYHADLTISSGVEYVWRGRVTSVIGQDRPVSLAGIWSNQHPVQSARTVGKEVAKQAMGRFGSAKYRFHAQNRTLGRSALRDGQAVIEFLRCNPHHGGVSSCDTGYGIAEVLNSRFLNQLVERSGVCILYTHLGKLKGRGFDPAAVDAFQKLAHLAVRKDILVTTTRRLLDYCRLSENLTATASQGTAGNVISVSTEATVVDGLTFHVTDPERTELVVNGTVVPTLSNPSDETGQRSISVPWRPLQFPSVQSLDGF
jgi:hypothetical protein